MPPLPRLLLLAAVTLPACQSERVGAADPFVPSAPVDFARDVQPIFAQNCGGGCHLDVVTSGVNLASYTAVLSSVGEQYGERIVQPGDPAASPLMDKIASPRPRFGERMPRGRAPLSAEQIGIIEAWIADGALPGTP